MVIVFAIEFGRIVRVAATAGAVPVSRAVSVTTDSAETELGTTVNELPVMAPGDVITVWLFDAMI
jgi:hypothetical protein